MVEALSGENAQVTRWRVLVKIVVHQSLLCCEASIGIDDEETVDQIDGRGDVHLVLQALPHVPLHVLVQLQIAIVLWPFDTRPGLRVDGAAEIGDELDLGHLVVPIVFSKEIFNKTCSDRFIGTFEDIHQIYVYGQLTVFSQIKL